MQSPKKCKILIIDGPEGLLYQAVQPLPNGTESGCEFCEHLYEAVGILSDLPTEVPMITVGTVGEFLRENGTFFAFLSGRPNIFCIALDPVGLDYAHPIRQAVWQGRLLICKTHEELRQAIGWALNNTEKTTITKRKSDPIPNKAESIISTEERNALFNTD